MWSDVSVIVCLIDSAGITLVLVLVFVEDDDDELARVLEVARFVLAPLIAAWSIGVEVGCCRMLRLVEEEEEGVGGDVEPTEDEDDTDEETEDEEALLLVELLLLLLLRLETVTSFCGDEELP